MGISFPSPGDLGPIFPQVGISGRVLPHLGITAHFPLRWGSKLARSLKWWLNCTVVKPGNFGEFTSPAHPRATAAHRTRSRHGDADLPCHCVTTRGVACPHPSCPTPAVERAPCGGQPRLRMVRTAGPHHRKHRSACSSARTCFTQRAAGHFASRRLTVGASCSAAQFCTRRACNSATSGEC